MLMIKKMLVIVIVYILLLVEAGRGSIEIANKGQACKQRETCSKRKSDSVRRSGENSKRKSKSTTLFLVEP